MQEEVTRKTIALAIKTAKLDGKVLQAALRKLLQLYRKARDTPHRGKQTLKQLMRHGTGVSNIEITDANIKAFESTAKKYGIDFALKKADDRYLVFFKGRDADVLTAAFREFSKKKLDKERKPSVRHDLAEKKIIGKIELLIDIMIALYFVFYVIITHNKPLSNYQVITM